MLQQPNYTEDLSKLQSTPRVQTSARLVIVTCM